MMTDPVADMLTRMRNALMVGKGEVRIPSSKLKVEIARILKAEGYIDDFRVGDEKPARMITIQLKYFGSRRDRRPVISKLQRVSKPGRRVYRGTRDMPRVMSGIGIAIVTTPQGVMTDQQARRQRVGGEVLCYVW
ncbi:MAG: 30S ribosomal protein S8 [Anaerolineae bacterium]|nr:30S ribosomal protein S8 [Anaerolineae bacterium]